MKVTQRKRKLSHNERMPGCNLASISFWLQETAALFCLVYSELVCTYYQESHNECNCLFINLSSFLPALSHCNRHKPMCSSYMTRTKKKTDDSMDLALLILTQSHLPWQWHPQWEQHLNQSLMCLFFSWLRCKQILMARSKVNELKMQH